MDSSTHKRYHEDNFDSRQHLESYLSDKADMINTEDVLKFPIENLLKRFTEGHVKGDILIDLSVGSVVHHLFAACSFFKHIIVLKMRDQCIIELKKMGGRTDQLQDKEGKVRSALQHIVKCNLEKEDIIDPIVLPPADCIISAWLLEIISKDKDDYIRYLRKFLKLLKPGGHIIIISSLEMTYYTVGNTKFHGLNLDEDFVRKALVGEGLMIDSCKVKKRTDVNDYIDYKAQIFIAAHKEI
ncbi:unnamed protein product [Ranitomeya imitator]|uniref:Uncharacterized protein n=1 Tax=Ranitomeya imitator TaxID=111125 RepID=A0ABN9MLV1_9NEOB|nr:unnamed protein product [Ranitomeya imitator]